MSIPFVGRLRLREWPYVIVYFFLAWLEFVISILTNSLPDWVIGLFTRTTRMIYRFTSRPVTLFQDIVKNDAASRLQDIQKLMNYQLPADTSQDKYNRLLAMLQDTDTSEMCRLFGYDVESFLVTTRDQYVLTIHRIVNHNKRAKRNGKVVYLHHGLLMSSEIWVTMLEKDHNLPFLLYDLGFDVWMGNNRGNKYSQKHLKYHISTEAFWDFSLDEFALYDIPDTINYILETTRARYLTYIGFSQGTAQAFASVSINPDLSNKIDQIIAISPATTPHGLYSKFLDIFTKASPSIMYLLFSRKILMPSVLFWRKIMYPPLFNTSIDVSNYLLFNWKSKNISKIQKLSSFAHLYLTTSVKTVVHWFQIIASKNFQMYTDIDIDTRVTRPISYPIKNIRIPITLIYGTTDSLVDIDVMKSQLPSECTKVQPVAGHEHLDNIWGEDVTEMVFKHVLSLLEIEDTTSLPKYQSCLYIET